MRVALCVAALCTVPFTARAQVIDIPTSAVAAAVPDAPGIGLQALFVRSTFGGFPPSLADARELLDGTSVAPAFDVWCGLIPYVDLTNATTVDSLGRGAPTAQCLPFLIDQTEGFASSCARLPRAPSGGYGQNGGASLRLRGRLALRAAGVYTLAWGHDDGMGFSLGGVPVFEFTGPTAPRVDRRAIRVAAPGLYDVQLEWFDGGGGALIDWYIAPGDRTDPDGGLDPFALVPPGDLYPSGALPCTSRCSACGVTAPHCDYATSQCVACTVDAHCSRCARCVAGRCEGGDCAVDASAPQPDARAIDVATADVAPAPAHPDGCACTAGRDVPCGHAAWIAGIVATVVRRRRAGCRG